MYMKKRLTILLVLLGFCLFGAWFFFSQKNSLQTGNEITIQGDMKCQKETREALQYLKEKTPEYFKMVEKYIGAIQCVASGSGIDVYERPPLFRVGDATREAGTEWYAGSIVHDSCHVWLYDFYAKKHPFSAVPQDVWSGKEAEMKCIDIQEKMLRQAGAPEWIFKSLDEARSSEYWEGERWW